MPSIIIPAHNEASVIGRCLGSLCQAACSESWEIIVVANGCTDDTAAKAKQFPSVTVLELDTASKVAALNAGDAIASRYPRVYLDADVKLSGADLAIALDTLRHSGALIVAPSLNVEFSAANRLVKCFYTIWTRLPYFSRKQMVGSGVYIIAEAGRARFGEFPDLVADDGYVRSLFSPKETRTLENCRFTIYSPLTASELIKIKRRVHYGNIQLLEKYPDIRIGSDNSPHDLLKLLLSQPALIPAGLVYVWVQLAARLGNKSRLREGVRYAWERDNSSRA